jgi:hypothetical protein
MNIHNREVIHMAEKKTISQIVDGCKPKNFKFKFIFTDTTALEELHDQGYDISSLDTIDNDELVAASENPDSEKEYDNDIFGKAKEPTIMDDGIILNRKMVSKVGKVLQKVKLGFFTYNEKRYIKITMVYERFNIIEIFALV